jgi:hypothetical protein
MLLRTKALPWMGKPEIRVIIWPEKSDQVGCVMWLAMRLHRCVWE